MNDSPSQQPLKLSRGNWIALAALLTIGWLGSSNDQSDPNTQAAVTRVTDQAISLPVFGIEVTPSEGWIYLRVNQPSDQTKLNFINPSQNLIATITPVEFKQWPPEMTPSERVARATANKQALPSLHPRFPIITNRMDTIDYQHISVAWFASVRHAYGIHRYGRIKSPVQELMIQIQSHPSSPSERSDAAVAKFCDRIRSI